MTTHRVEPVTEDRASPLNGGYIEPRVDVVVADSLTHASLTARERQVLGLLASLDRHAHAMRQGNGGK